MAYRLEKEPNGDTAIVIDGWDKGMAPDPYSGLGTMLSANLSTPGEISVGYPLSFNVLGTGTLNWPIHKAIKETAGTATGYFILDSASQVWSSTTYNGTFSFLSTSNTTTGATLTNQGLAYWKGYLIKFRNSHIDYLAGGAGTWVSTWNPADGSTTAGAVIVADVPHFAYVSVDNTLYFCNGSGIGSIIENPNETFDPTNTNTYTFSASNGTTGINALSIPFYEVAQSIAEAGNNLLVGGSFNAIYPWDKLSPFFSYPIFIGDTFIDRMVTVNTNAYIFAGGTTSRGRIFITNGSQANLFYKIPDYITSEFDTNAGEQDPYFTWGDAIYHRNNLIFSFFMIKNGGGYITADVNFQVTSQLWGIDLETNAFRGLSILNAATVIGRAGVLMPALQTSPGFGYIAGVQDSTGVTTANIQYSGTAVGTGRFNVYTDKIPVGTFIDKKTFSEVEFKLRTGLASGETLAIVPISDNVSQTQFLANTLGQISDVYPVTFEKGQWLQFLIQGNGTSPNSGVRLREIRIR